MTEGLKQRKDYSYYMEEKLNGSVRFNTAKGKAFYL